MKNKYYWHTQSKEDIYDSFNDWFFHSFKCIMTDGSIRRFIGYMDENYNGEINKYVHHEDDEYDIDDIVYWWEITDFEKQLNII